MFTETPYDDEYPTCVYTHAWFRVMSEDLQPESVTLLLGIQPTRTQVRGDLPGPISGQPHKFGGWFRWDSIGHGGPTLTPVQMTQLGELGIELWFDVYFAGEEDDELEN